MSAIGARVRELRKARGLSQHALAGDGISAGYISLIESGKRTPSREVAEQLAAALGVPVERLLEVSRPMVSDTARIEANFARLALANGDPAQALDGLRHVNLHELDSQSACDAALVLAESLQQTGQLDKAVEVLESLTERLRLEQSWVALATAASALTVMYLESGDVAQALDVVRHAMSSVEGAGLQGTDEHLRLGAALASCLIERGDLLAAARQMDGLISVADRFGSSRARGSVYWNAATVAHERGRVADAIRLTDRAVALFSDQENSRDLPRLRLEYAFLLLNQERPQPVEALDQLDRAESDPALAGSQLDLGIAATFRGRAHLLLGEVDDAAEHAARALQLLGPSDHIEHASALILLGDVGTAQLDMDLAQEAFNEAERVLSELTPSRAVARLWRELADGLRDFGESHRAIEAYDHGFRIMGIGPRPKPLVELQLGRTNYATR